MSDFQPIEPTSFGDLYPGRFLRADSSAFAGGKKQVYTIERVLLDQLEGDKEKELKVIVVFRETAQAWVMPKICGFALKAMFGGDVTRWHGKRVCLYATDTQMPMPPKVRGTKPEPCLRVYGSPDIAADMTIEFCPSRRKPVSIPLKGPSKKPEPSEIIGAADRAFPPGE